MEQEDVFLVVLIIFLVFLIISGTQEGMISFPPIANWNSPEPSIQLHAFSQLDFVGRDSVFSPGAVVGGKMLPVSFKKAGSSVWKHNFKSLYTGTTIKFFVYANGSPIIEEQAFGGINDVGLLIDKIFLANKKNQAEYVGYDLILMTPVKSN